MIHQPNAETKLTPYESLLLMEKLMINHPKFA